MTKKSTNQHKTAAIRTGDDGTISFYPDYSKVKFKTATTHEPLREPVESISDGNSKTFVFRPNYNKQSNHRAGAS